MRVMLLAFFAVLVTGAIGTPAHAQDADESCPCFSAEEAKAVFLSGADAASSGGSSNCSAQDYSVEFSAEFIVLDENFSPVSRASVNWADYKTSSCAYEDNAADPPVERNETWPNPAPEGPARGCLDVITSVISELDTSGTCITYP